MNQQAKQHLPKLVATSTDHASAALRWFNTMRRPEEWGLTIEEQVELLGGVKKRTFQEWKKKALEGEPVPESWTVR